MSNLTMQETFDSLVILSGLNLGIFLPVAISGLLPGTNASVISSSDEKITCDKC